MAKRTSGRGNRQTATDRPKPAGGPRRTGRQPTGILNEDIEALEDIELETQPQGGRGARLVSGAREVAQNVGETTVQAAQSTLGAARGLASGAADAAGSVAGKVRENPWPTLLIGAGATWLAIDAVRGRSNAGSERAARPAEGGRGAVKGAVSKVARAGRAAGEQIEEFVRDRPLLAGAATLGIGVAVGMALPASVTENEVLGEARDTVVRRAKQAAQGTAQKVRDVTESLERMGPFGGASSGRGSSGGRGSSRG